MEQLAMYLLAAICFASGGILGYKQIPGWGWPFFVGFLIAIAASGATLVDIKT